ncbi:CHAP domain-containing protein [Pedobacter glucosidilyticus]|uniref:CHAP domain-containing protein n=1 Tax=Pedobacter glucosidilyticus TaxID=1122941 RepID=UPI0003FA9956|nr:CHAP domain-containing protein [Pedobacter glucosidilyticus]
MSKNHHLFKLLSITSLWLYLHTHSHFVKAGIGSASRTRLKNIYSQEIGTREKSNRNDGSRVESYLQYTGHSKGAPWCAAFVSWCLGKAGISNPQTAWSPALLPQKRIIWKNTWQQEKIQPQAGDVFGIWYASKKRIAHCGFIDAWGDSIIITVEGNTNEAGSREGDGVYRKRRLKRTLYAVADWVTARRESI